MIPIEWIIEAGCIALGTTPEEMCGPDRHRPLVARRAFIAWQMRRENYSYPEIGAALGGRHHTTIMALLGQRRPPRRAPWRTLRGRLAA